MLRLIVVGKDEAIAKLDAEWTVSGEVSAEGFQKQYEIAGRSIVLKAFPCGLDHKGGKPSGDALLFICRAPGELEMIEPVLQFYGKMPLKFVLYDGAPAQSTFEAQRGFTGSQKKAPADFAGQLIEGNNKFVGLVMKVFKDFDKDNSGFIDLGEITAVAKELGTEISPVEAAQIMQELDINKDKKISMEEFVEWWKTGRQGRAGKMTGLVTEWLKKHQIIRSLSDAAAKFAAQPHEEQKLGKSSFAIHVNRVKAAGLLFEVSFMSKGTNLDNEFQLFSGAVGLAPDQPFVGLALGVRNPKVARESLEGLINAVMAMAGAMVPQAEMFLSMAETKFGETSNKAVFCLAPSAASQPIVDSFKAQLAPLFALGQPNQLGQFYAAFATDLKKLITEDKPFYELLLDGLSIEMKSESSSRMGEAFSKMLADQTIQAMGMPHLGGIGAFLQAQRWFAGSNGELEFEVDQELKDLIKETLGPNPASVPLKDLKAMVAPQIQEVIGGMPLLDQVHKLFKEQVTSIEWFFYIAGFCAIKISLDLPGLEDFLALS